MGNILHGFILVPYYPWKLSHRHHHKNTGNIDKEEIFYPVRKGRDDFDGNQGKFVPFFGLGFGWFYYLFKGYSPRKVYHFNPWDVIMSKNSMACLISILVCIGNVLGILAIYAYLGLGFGQFITHYIGPLFFFASWLVVTTFLHHQVLRYFSNRPKIGIENKPFFQRTKEFRGIRTTNGTLFVVN